MGGKTTIEAPKADPAESALRKEQASLLALQKDAILHDQQVNELLQPFLMEQAGVTALYGNQTKIDDLNAQKQALVDQQGGFEVDQGRIDQLTQERDDLSERRIAAKTSDQKRRIATQMGEKVAEIKQLRSGGEAGGANAQQIADIDSQISQLQSTAGDITGFEEITDPAQAKRDEAEGLLLDRELAALKGELPIDPGLLKDLDKRDQAFENELRTRFGGDLTSSPALEAIQAAKDSRSTILDQARRGDLSLASQLQLQQGAFNQATTQTGISNALGITGSSNPFASQFGAGASGFGTAQQGFQFDRSQQFAARKFNASQPSPFGQIAGAIAGAGIGAFTGGAGSELGAKFGASLFDKEKAGTT
jgi:hypothetical protein